jgi:tetratricopeptide (TPR) repeat protein
VTVAVKTIDAPMRERFQRYRGLFPEELEDRCWAAVGDSFDEDGDGPRTIAAYKQAIAVNPEWGRWHLSLAKAYLRARRFPEAIVHLQSCAELESSGCDGQAFSENVLYYLGYALFAAARYKEAAEAWRGAETSIKKWGHPEPLKDFHLHRGWAYHLEGNLLDAIESYRRGMVAPGPGDGSVDDSMDEDEVEAAQNMNDAIMTYHDLAKGGISLDPKALAPVPYTR